MKYLALLISVVAACSSDPPDAPQALARALVQACPLADPADIDARDACAEALTEFPELRDRTSDPLLWGGQPPGLSPDELLSDAHLTEFNPRVWRRMYLSTYMFEDRAATVEVVGQYRVLRVPVRFRQSLPAGEYPYPFWHSQPKWTSYERATDLLFVYDRDTIKVAVRANTQDPDRPHVERTFDGMWTWDGGAEPRVSLYRYLFSIENPHVARLETAYRELEEGLREQTCVTCHDPSNMAGMKHLELLSYPNQALAGRHDVPEQIERMFMPPAATGSAMGITDPDARAELALRAKEFEAAGDLALAYEGE